MNHRISNARRMALAAGPALVAALVLSVLSSAPSADGAPRPAKDASPSAICAKNASGSVSDDVKSTLCTALTNDLAGIGGRLGLPPIVPNGTSTDPVRVIFDDDADPTGDLLSTAPFIAGILGGGMNEPCQVTIYPTAIAQIKGTVVPPVLNASIAHEAVHCYQNLVANQFKSGLAAKDAFPAWVGEGSATYLGTDYAQSPEAVTPSFWDNGQGFGWLKLTTRDVIQRSYDAVGWYSLIAKQTGDPLWGRFVSAWRAYLNDGTLAYIKALGGDDPRIAQGWGASLLNSPEWGDAWSTPGIGVPPGDDPSEITVLGDQPGSRTAPISALAAIVDKEPNIKDGLVEISVTDGFASVHDDNGDSYLGFTDGVFCVNKKSCSDSALACSGSLKPLEPEPLSTPFYVGVGGANAPATYEIATIPDPPTPTTPTTIPSDDGPCHQLPALSLPKSAFSEGEPHIQTLNGDSYDFQGAGEYTLIRSGDGDIDVQVRAAPFEGTDSVAFNTAVAMRVVSTDVEVDAGSPPVLLIDGKRVSHALSSPRALRGGGQLRETNYGTGDDFDVTWPDGSELDVYAAPFGENVTFVPSAPGLDNFSGLLTALSAIATHKNTVVDTFIGGDGHRYVIDPTTSAGFKTLYGPFAASWRITKNTSLFTYPRGESPATFVKKGFPARLVSASLLPSGERQRAEAACKHAGVSGSTLLADCEVDVVETGKQSFATATARIQTSTQTRGGSAPKNPTVAGGGHPASYYFTHPCAAVSLSEIVKVVGATDSMSVGTPGTCEFRPDSSSEVDVIVFSHKSARVLAATTPGKASSGPVAALGDDAYCIVNPSFTDQSYVIDTLGNPGSIQILAASCAQGIALTKDALTRISGG